VNEPLVTIVTPSFNQGRFIRATIESVLGQDYPNLEYLIIDGGSTDETAAVAAEFGDRLTFISEPDRGQSDAINKGFRLARGSIVAWMNSDDVFMPGAIRTAVAAFEQEPALGALYGNGYQIDAEGRTISAFASSQAFDLWRLIHVSDYILQQTTFFRRAIFDEIGLCDEDLHFGLDWELFMRIGKRFSMKYLPVDMACIREYEVTKTASGGPRRFRELASIMRRHGELRFPPGYFVYGLDTYYPRWNARIARTFRGPFRRLGARLEHLVTRIAHFVVYRASRHGQGRFSDGWAAKSMRFWLPNTGERHVRMDVELPGWPKLRGQRIDVFFEGAFLTSLNLETGRKNYFFDVPQPSKPGDPIKLKLVARRAVWEESVPMRYRRHLAYILHDFRSTEHEG
jgi:glycosyltransferase involved in cell wall biosynthesis